MKDILGGLRDVFWNPEEQRFRALVRFIATLGLFLFAVSLVEVVGFLSGSALASVGVGTAVRASLVQLLVVALAVVATVGIIFVVDRRYLHDLGLSMDARWRADLLAGLGTGAAMAVGTVGTALVAGVATVDGVLVSREAGQFQGLSPAAALVLAAAMFALLVTLYEVLFRGYLIVNTAEGLVSLLGDRRAVGVGVGLSSVLFALAHVPLPGVSPSGAVLLGLLGLLLAATVAVTGQLALALGIHTAWALLLAPVFGLPFRGFDVSTALVRVEFDGASALTGGAFGPEGGLVSLVGLAVGATVVVAYLRRQPDGFEIAPALAVPDLWADND